MGQIDFDSAEMERFCRENHVRTLSFFGSVLTDKFRPDSDIDVLIEFADGHVPGLFKMARLQRELSDILNGRDIDLRTAAELSPYFRETVLKTAVCRYSNTGI